MKPLLAALVALSLAACAASPSPRTASDPVSAPLRIATYNTSLNDDRADGLVRRLEAGDDRARDIAAVIQRVRPDIVLLNEFDYDDAHRAADLFAADYLARGQHGQAPIRYAYRYLAPVNTGVPSGMDLDRNGRAEGPNDAWGFGRHPGQYGMLVLSRFPIDAAQARTFRLLPWSAMPDALAPVDPATGQAWYPPQVWSRLRLSSKSHWDLPIDTPQGRLHLLAAHPTPPVFDGPEDRNGARNHDEIRFWAEYVGTGARDWIVDDAGRRGGLGADAAFVIVGDYNADPVDGDSTRGAILQLLEHPRVLDYPAPSSAGAVQAAARDGGANLAHRGDAAHDTGNFGPQGGNLRVDYVLPSAGTRVLDGGVFWPAAGDTGHAWTRASDHHLVWVEVVLGEAGIGNRE
ncbi:endonuclease/exonuclease/phosphatase family protein [Coralloluteibacterium stylophorae]|uniref:Endonuclease/exonuclease/phosphatase family protein n=1 Tax=Coralloluteibacterium stylophorae TaxID=1776034 RepID=A0A8J8AX01_9GAMM|nr:endonuclease/exonuclease/phosphatase family protein [Coralloluteibacterium stylophorae]MBS7455530.1 endonuclease/exonuclease/phosphatase family protein [Coralloluteibacterium stylophorae]